MLERKIVRLIIMANISRRQFLKSAGVAALAVAALTGCQKIPDTDIPDVPEVTSVDLRVLFVDEKGNPVGNSVTGVYETTVLKDAKKYDPKLIPADKLPKGYELISEDEVDIISESTPKIAKVPVKLEESKPASQSKVFVTLKFFNGGVADRHVEVIANKVFDLKSNPNERVCYADIKDSLLAQCKDIEPDETWESYLKIVDGGYEATVWMGVALKG